MYLEIFRIDHPLKYLVQKTKTLLNFTQRVGYFSIRRSSKYFEGSGAFSMFFSKVIYIQLKYLYYILTKGLAREASFGVLLSKIIVLAEFFTTLVLVHQVNC